MKGVTGTRTYIGVSKTLGTSFRTCSDPVYVLPDLNIIHSIKQNEQIHLQDIIKKSIKGENKITYIA